VNAFIVRQHPMITITEIDQTILTTANLNPGSISTLTATLAKIANGGVRGATTSYAVTGHLHVESVAGAKPGTVRKVCAGHGGITTHRRSSCVTAHRQHRGHAPCTKICRFKSYLSTLVFDNKVTKSILCKN
jgi:hypothetical protein